MKDGTRVWRLGLVRCKLDIEKQLDRLFNREMLLQV
jgi:hypothetical protein